jgi:hypothetical protein
MRAVVVEVVSEFEQLVFQICRRPEKRAIQILASKGADQPFHERVGQGNVGDGLDFCHLQYPQIGLPLAEPIKGIVVGTEVVRHPALPSNGAVEHPTKRATVDRSRMDAEPNDPARKLIHDHQDPVGPQRGRLAPEQIDTPETVFHVAQERQPGGTTGVLSRPVVKAENPANHVFVDLDVEREAICWAIRGQPQLGLRCFISTTTRMSSALGPFGPGFRRRFGENSIRYFRLLMAL